jgi:hypothetical protein
MPREPILRGNGRRRLGRWPGGGGGPCPPRAQAISSMTLALVAVAVWYFPNSNLKFEKKNAEKFLKIVYDL